MACVLCKRHELVSSIAFFCVLRVFCVDGYGCGVWWFVFARPLFVSALVVQADILILVKREIILCQVMHEHVWGM